MLILSPRASRMAPRDADAMPLPSAETKPRVTNTNRVMWSPPIYERCTPSAQALAQKQPIGNNRNSTGVQVSRTRGPRQYTFRAQLQCPTRPRGTLERFLDNNRPPPPLDGNACRAHAHAPARVQPQVGNRNQVTACEHQWQRITHPRQHALRLTQVLHAVRFGIRSRLQRLAPLPPAHRQMLRQAPCIEAAVLRHPA